MPAPTVVFHILQATGEQARHRHVCQLVEQAYEQNLRVFVRADSPATTQRLDELLWTYSQRTFIPHAIHPDATSHHSPHVAALIGTTTAPTDYLTMLINLAQDLPPQLNDCLRIAEVIDADATQKQQGRERYKQYREQGCALETVNVD